MSLNPYLQRLSRRLFALTPGARCRLWFSGQVAPFVAVEPLDEAGTKRFGKILNRAKSAPPEERGTLGVLIVGEHGLQILARKGSRAMLEELATLVKARVDRAPALAVFADARVGAAKFALKDSAAIEAIDTSEIVFHEAPELWDRLRTPSVAGVAAVLETRPLGAMTWCAVRNDPDQAVILVPAEEDPRQHRFRLLIESLPFAPSWTGAAAINPNGRWQLSSFRGEARAIEYVAAWVERFVGQHPALARLRDFEIAVPEPDGTVGAVFSVPDAWEGTPLPAHEVQLAAAAPILAAMGVGENAWALGARGLLWLGPTQGGRDALDAMRGPFTARFDGALVGVLSRLQGGWVLTSDPQSASGWTECLASVATEAGFEALADAVVVGSDGSPVDVQPVDRVLAVRTQAAALEALDTESNLLFWVLPADQNGEPVVVVGSDKDSVMASSKRWSAGQTQGGVRGRVHRSPDGLLEFRAKSEVADLLTPLSRWAGRHRPQVPALAALSGARYVRVRADGTTETQSNDALWAQEV